jgi:hypothetical protein
MIRLGASRIAERVGRCPEAAGPPHTPRPERKAREAALRGGDLTRKQPPVDSNRSARAVPTHVHREAAHPCRAKAKLSLGGLGGVERTQHVIRGNDREEKRVDPVEHTAVRGEDAARVLDLHVPF